MLTQAKIAKTAKIADTAIIGDKVVIGENTEIKDYVIVRDGVTIGKNNTIYPQAVIGEDPQDKSFCGEESFVEIGDNNIIRENVTIHKACGAGEVTKLGNDNYLMVGVHLAHNVTVGNNNTIANNVSLAGHSEVGNFVTFGGAAQIHQNCRIGDYSMISGLAGVNNDVLPFMIIGDIPARAITTNRIALKKYGFDQKARSDIMLAFRIIYEQSLSVSGIIEELSEVQGNEHIAKILDFIKNSKRGIITQKYSR